MLLSLRKPHRATDIASGIALAGCLVAALIGLLAGMPPPVIAGSIVEQSGVEDDRVPPIDLAPYRELLATRRLVEQGELQAARDRLDAAASEGLQLVPAALARARLDLRLMPQQLPQDVDNVRRGIMSSFPLQSLWLSRGMWWAIGTLLLGLTLVTAARALTLIAPLHHLLFERLSPATDERFARVAAATILSLPLIWGLGPLISALILVALGLRQISRGDRALITVGASLVVLIAGGAAWLPAYLAPSDYRDSAMVLADAQYGRLTPPLAARLATIETQLDPEQVPEVRMGQLIRGITLRRGGDPTAARRVLTDYVRQAPLDPIGQIALGNCWLDAGEPLRAAERYEQALALDATSVEATYNQALALAGMLRFEESTRLLDRAAALDFGAVRTASLAAGTKPVPLDPAIPTGRLWSLYRLERDGRGLKVPWCVRVWLPWRGGRLWPMALAALCLALLLRRPLWRRLSTFECSICGRTVCRRCVRRARSRIFCRGCAEDVGDVPSEQLVRILAEGRRRRRQQRTNRPGLVLACLLPGYELLRRDRPAYAGLTAGIFAAGVMGIWIARDLPALPPAPAVFNLPIATLLAAAVALAGFVGAAVLGQTLRERDLTRGVRGHLVPLAEPLGDSSMRTGTDG